MDFSKFRDTGELSDINIVVDGKEFKLHKFPLYIKSDFFRALARSPKGDESIKLEEFPGGADTFAEVANYFYNVKINVTRQNVCKLRCAAEYLQMCSPGNLAAISDRYLQDTLTSAKLGHKLDIIAEFIGHCKELGPIAEQAGVVEKCLNAVVDCWLISPKFSRRYAADFRLQSDLDVVNQLCEFPLDWYKLVCVTAREKSIRPNVLANLVQVYISHAVDKKFGTKKTRALETEKPLKGQEGEKEDGKKSKGDSSQEESGKKVDDTDDQESDQDSEDTDKKGESQEEVKKPEEDKEGPEDPDLDIGKIMDALLFEIPLENPLLVESFSHTWVIQMLKIAEEVRCDSREVLLILSGKMLHRYTKEDLSGLSPDHLAQIVAEGCKDKQTDPDDVCRVLDDYLMDQAEKDKLSVDTFQKLVDAVPKDSRTSHDMLFQVLEALLKSERISVDDKKKQELLETIDFGRLSESTLQRAYDSGLVPGAYVTKAALTLCAKLRSDLDTAKAIIRDQELRLERYGLAPGPDYDHPYTHNSARSPRGGATPSLASDYELKMALDSLDRSLDRTVESMGPTDTGPPPSSSKALHYSSYYGDREDSFSLEKPYTSSYLWNRSYGKYASK